MLPCPVHLKELPAAPSPLPPRHHHLVDIDSGLCCINRATNSTSIFFLCALQSLLQLHRVLVCATGFLCFCSSPFSQVYTSIGLRSRHRFVKMPCFRGIDVSIATIQSQVSNRLPEFPHPDGSSVNLCSPGKHGSAVFHSPRIANPSSSSSEHDAPRSNPKVSVYIPSVPGEPFSPFRRIPHD